MLDFNVKLKLIFEICFEISDTKHRYYCRTTTHLYKGAESLFCFSIVVLFYSWKNAQQFWTLIKATQRLAALSII